MIRGKHWVDGWLTAYWGRESRREPKELMFGCPCKSDASLLNWIFSHAKMWGGGEENFLKELESRGYDLSTIQFSIKRKWKPNEKPVPAEPSGNPGGLPDA